VRSPRWIELRGEAMRGNARRREASRGLWDLHLTDAQAITPPASAHLSRRALAIAAAVAHPERMQQ
jgi:hypothetical protein